MESLILFIHCKNKHTAQKIIKILTECAPVVIYDNQYVYCYNKYINKKCSDKIVEYYDEINAFYENDEKLLENVRVQIHRNNFVIPILMKNVTFKDILSESNPIVCDGELVFYIRCKDNIQEIIDALVTSTNIVYYDECIAGSITDVAGNITDVAGNITSAAGNITSAAGNITSAAGNITSTAGNITSAAGNITSAAGAILCYVNDNIEDIICKYHSEKKIDVELVYDTFMIYGGTKLQIYKNKLIIPTLHKSNRTIKSLLSYVLPQSSSATCGIACTTCLNSISGSVCGAGYIAGNKHSATHAACGSVEAGTVFYIHCENNDIIREILKILIKYASIIIYDDYNIFCYEKYITSECCEKLSANYKLVEFISDNTIMYSEEEKYIYKYGNVTVIKTKNKEKLKTLLYELNPHATEFNMKLPLVKLSTESTLSYTLPIIPLMSCATYITPAVYIN